MLVWKAAKMSGHVGPSSDGGMKKVNMRCQYEWLSSKYGKISKSLVSNVKVPWLDRVNLKASEQMTNGPVFRELQRVIES